VRRHRPLAVDACGDLTDRCDFSLKRLLSELLLAERLVA
jgi:hypothetical protein